MKKALLIGINSKYVHTNLAIRYIREYCKSKNVNVEIYENSINNSLLSIIRDIFELNPEIAAFSVYIWNVEYIFKIIAELKKIAPQIKIYLGGPEVAYNAEEILKNNQHIDGIFTGEGEQSFYEFMQYGAEKTRGIIYRNGDDIIKNKGDIFEISNIDCFPYSDSELKEKAKIFYYESSRGCPYSCSYCISSIEKRVRYYDLEIVKKHLKKFIDFEVKLVKFIDRTFNLDKKRYMEIWSFLNENYTGKTSFHFEIAADIFDDDVIDFLNKLPNGYFQFEIGVQSSNIETLKAINRKTNLEKIKENLKKLKKNIHLHLDLIAGLPYENYEIFKNSFNFVYNINPVMIQLGFLKILKGTKLAEEAKSGYSFTDFPPYEVIKTPYIKFEEIVKLKDIEEILDLYYNSGKFKNSLPHIIKNNFATPFEFYDNLRVFWYKMGFHKIAHKPVSLFEYLHQFFLEGDYKEYELFIEKLKFDYLLLGKPGYYPEWFKKNSCREKYKKAVENSKYFKSEKDGYKNSEFEIFYLYFKTPKAVLFIYNSDEKEKIEVLDLNE